jgi:hypothetical protein
VARGADGDAGGIVDIEEQTMTIMLSRPVEAAAGARIRAGTFATPAAVRQDRPATPPPVDIIDQWGMDSFPASDPPANW